MAVRAVGRHDRSSQREGDLLVPVVRHPVFEPPEDEAAIWRYMDLPRFVSLLDRRALYFPSADRLGDPFEGSYPAANLEARRRLFGQRLGDYQQVPERERRRRLRTTLVNCWHLNEVESAGMWRLYSGAGPGVAVRSSYARLVRSLEDAARPVFIGMVRYIRYEVETMPEDNYLAAFVHKRKGFEHERELRAIVDARQDVDRAVPPAAWPETGEYVPVRLEDLVVAVHVSPSSPRWFVDVVRAVIQRFALPAQIVQSQLDGTPQY
jgi:hypothetical protein